MSRATSCRVQDLGLAKGNRARTAGFEATSKVCGIRALELALEEPIELSVPWCFLAILHAERIRLQGGV
jgi:hypothetical protein